MKDRIEELALAPPVAQGLLPPPLAHVTLYSADERNDAEGIEDAGGILEQAKR